MAAPFYNAIKGTTSGTPGTGAFTPNAAATGARAWSNAQAGFFLVRYEDGTAWELTYSYWDGTTLSRATKQFFDSSTGSPLSLTSSATAALEVDANAISPSFADFPVRGWFASPTSTTITAIGMQALSATGTVAASSVPAATNVLTAQPRVQSTSATTASAQAGWTLSFSPVLVSSTAGIGGFEFGFSFGASQLPTSPRLMVGATNNGYSGSTVEPSALVDKFSAFTLDSTDTTIQFTTRNSGTSVKQDTAIALVANAWYRAKVWTDPGSLTVYGLLMRMDTGDIWFGSSSSNTPVTGTLMRPALFGSLNGTNTGTTIVMHMGHVTVRQVS